MTKTLNNKLKTLFYFLLNNSVGRLQSKRAAILMYHSIDVNPVFFTVKPEEFEKQMAYLYENNYNVVSLDKLLEYHRAKNIPQRTVVLTFDDGYLDNYLNVLPVLKRYKYPAVIFLATGFIEKGLKNSAGVTLPMLDWGQIKEMHHSGLIDFEPHSHTHQKLTQISLLEAEREIKISKSIIEKNLGKECRFFAYPWGWCNTQIISILKANNFKGAVTTKEGLVSSGDDQFLLKRNSIDSLSNFHQFRGKLNVSINIFRAVIKD